MGIRGEGMDHMLLPSTNMGRGVVEEHVLLPHRLAFNFFHVYISNEIIKLDGVPNIIGLE